MKQFSFFQVGKTTQRFQKIVKWPLRALVVIAIMAFMAPLIANEKPLYVFYKGHHLFPAFGIKNAAMIRDPETGVSERLQYDITEWKKIKTGMIIFSLIPYSPGKSDLINADYRSPAGSQYFETHTGEIIPIPWRYRHFLGTGMAGEDILAGLIHGTRVSFFVSLISILIASFIGIGLGAVAGYFGDYTLRITKGEMLGILVGLIPAWFYGFQIRYYQVYDGFGKSGFAGMVQIFLSVCIFIVILSVCYKAGKLLNKAGFLKKKLFVPVDSLISRLIEVFLSLPRLVIIITMAAVFEPSFINLVVILSLIIWPDIARLTRAELLRQRELDYIIAARSLGFSNLRIIFRHALPNSAGPVLVSMAFMAALTILIESSLSFLGIGVPLDVVTWGSLLAAGKENIEAWWLIAFPGLAVFVMVVIYNLLGEGMRKALLH